jgi:hypothetical protein
MPDHNDRDISRRRFVGLIGTTAAAALTSSLPVPTDAASATLPAAELRPHFARLADRLVPAWAEWERTAAEVAPLFDKMRAVAAGGDLDANLSEDDQQAIIAFNGACRDVWINAVDSMRFFKPANDSERAVKELALSHRRRMWDSDSFGPMDELMTSLIPPGSNFYVRGPFTRAAGIQSTVASRRSSTI